MVYNKQSKVAFICPTRTGSTTLHSYFSEQGWFRLKEKHHSLDALIGLYPNLAQYKVYGFLRNPLSRFESCVLYAKQNDFFCKSFQYKLGTVGIIKNLKDASYDEFVDCFDRFAEFGGFLFKPQSFWLNDQRVTVLDFDNIESELNRAVGALPDSIPVLHKSTDLGRSEITDKVRSFVREYYAADYALAKDRLGKEY
jgi:hypothetical protein